MMTDRRVLFAERNRLIDTENAFKIGPHIARVAGQGNHVVKLNLGEPDSNIPSCVKEELKRQIDKNNTHYTDPQGILPLREAICQQMKTMRGLDVTPDRVVVFPGAKPIIGFTQQIYLDPGDEVIYPSPGFPIYESFVRYVGGVPVPIHLKADNGFQLDPEQLADHITDKTKLIILNFPSNPTGGVATQEQLEGIAQVIQSRCGPEVRVYADEIYEYIVFDGKKHLSIASVPGMEERTLISSGMSKTFAGTGVRVGWLVAPSAEEAERYKTLNINYFSCVPPFIQEAAREGLENPEAMKEVQQMVATFQKRRDQVVPALNAIPGVTCQTPGGAFYLFPNIKGVCENLGLHEAVARTNIDTSPSTLFQMFALYHHHVAVMDRRSFGRIGTEIQHFLRLSYASELPELLEGVKRLRAATEDREGLEAFIRAGQNLSS
jgi:aspartate aminotransferase